MSSAIVLLEAASLWRRAPLTVIGGSLEVLGLALLSLDFWWPAFSDARRDLESKARHWVRRTRDRLRRTVDRLRRRTAVVAPPGLAHARGIGPLEVIAPPARPKSLAAMTRELYEFERRLREVEGRQTHEAEDLRRRIDSITGVVEDMIRRSKDQYLGARIVGLALALTGAFLLSAANLVPA